MNSTLTKKAIQAALDKDWSKAVNLNEKVLEGNPSDLKALLRLGKALIHEKEYEKAAKTFEKVLKADPINKIAQKNLAKIGRKAKSIVNV